MPLDFTETTITAAVQETFAGAKDERTQTLFVELVRHLHDLAREVRLTGDEWFTAVDFLERVGQISGPTRQEVVLLSDILGLSVLVDQINHANAGSTTDSTLLGPFYVEGRPRVDNGSDISGGVSGVPLFFSGTVRDTDGKPISGVHVDTWHSDSKGFYDVQQKEKLHNQSAMRALLTTDDNGRFWYRSIVPRYYPVPTDGPCGEILRAAGRSPMRPEHIHFWFRAEGYQPLITMLFRAGDPYLESDAVFGAKRSLVAEFVEHPADETAPDGTVMSEPFQALEWTFTLARKEG